MCNTCKNGDPKIYRQFNKFKNNTKRIRKNKCHLKIRDNKNSRYDKKGAKKLEIKKMDELNKLDRSLNFSAIKNRFWRKSNNFREELRLREITRKKMKEIQKLKAEIKEMKRLRIETIELKSSKLLGDLNLKKGFEIEEIIEIEIKLEKLKIPTTVINTIKKSIISEEYMHHILRHRKYCA